MVAAAAKWSRVRRCLGGLLLTLLASLAAIGWCTFYFVTRAAIEAQSAPEGTPMSALGGALIVAVGGVAIVATGGAAVAARENGWWRLGHVLIVLVVAGLGALVWGLYAVSG